MEQNAKEIWIFQNFKLIYEYRLNEILEIKLWPLPPPFNLINFPVFLIKLCFKKKIKNQNVKLMSEENEEIYEIITGILV